MSAADLIVVGLGAMGSAVAHHAQQQGLHVVGIDRHDPPHSLGSSHAETRITRLAVGEGEQYLPFVARSHEIWRELEAKTGERLFHETGGYIVTPRGDSSDDRWGDFVTQTAAVAEVAGVDFEVRAAAAVRAALPNVKIGEHERVGFEPTAGLVMVERAVAVQLAEAEAAGAHLYRDERVEHVEADDHGVTVRTDRSVYTAPRAVMAAGPWTHDLVGEREASLLTVTRQVVIWFEVEERRLFSTERFPFFIWAGESIEDYLGVFAIPAGGVPGLKIVTEQFHEATSPDRVDRTVSPEEIRDVYERLVKPRLNGVGPGVVRAEVCLYTNTPNDHFVVDTADASDRIMLMSPCSGHGFKHSTALGEAVAEWAGDGRIPQRLSTFGSRGLSS